MEKRATVKNYYKDEAKEKAISTRHDALIKQLSSSEETIANGIGSLLDFMDKKISKTELINQLDTIKTPDVQKAVAAIEKLNKDVLGIRFDTKPLTDALNSVKREITLIPSKMPVPKEQKDSIKVSNLEEVKLDTSELEKAIKALDLKVDVKAPIVNVEKPDLKPLQDILLDVLKAINKQKPVKTVEISNFPEQKATDLSKVEKKLDLSNKHLKTISEKRFGGGGGGGNGSPYVDGTGKIVNVELSSGSIPVIPNETVPTDSSKTNGSIVLGYTAGKLTTITKTIGTTQYQKTLSYTVDDLTGISSWVEL